LKHISVKLPDYLYQALEEKAQTLGVNISEIVRDSIRFRLQNIWINSSEAFDSTLSKIAQLNSLDYSVLSYCLLEAFIENTVEDSHELCKEAQEKARQLHLLTVRK
jgi:Arc/MetJ-type ribon-helix-helix transcriptional regulator